MHKEYGHHSHKHHHGHHMRLDWYMKFLSDEDKKKIALKKLEMKISCEKQRVELLEMLHELIKSQ